MSESEWTKILGWLQEPDTRPTVGASGQVTAKPISIKLTGGKSGGCASKVVELTSGDLRQGGANKIGRAGNDDPKARTVPRKRNKGKGK